MDPPVLNIPPERVIPSAGSNFVATVVFLFNITIVLILWLTSVFSNLFILILPFGAILVLYTLLYYVRYAYPYAAQMLMDVYELTALIANYTIDKANIAWGLAQPFTGVYNIVIYLTDLQRKIFWAIMTPSFVVFLVRKAIDLTWMLIPVVIDFLVAIIPLITLMIPSFIQIVTALLTPAVIQTLIILIRLFLQLVLALVPVIPPLFELAVLVIRIVVEQLQKYFVMIVSIIFILIEAFIPFIQGIIPDLIATMTTIQTDIAAAGTGIQWYDYVLIVVADSVSFVVDVTIAFYVMLINLAVTNQERITDFVASLLIQITAVVPPIVTSILVIAATRIDVIVGLFETVVGMLMDLVGPIFSIVNSVILSGKLVDLFVALVHTLLYPHSPVFLETLIQAIAEVFETALDVIIGGMIAIVDFYLQMFIIEVRLFILIVTKPEIPVLIIAVVNALNTLLPVLVQVFLNLLIDVFFGVILRALLENLALFVVAVADLLTVILVAMQSQLLSVLSVIIDAFVELMPTLIDITGQLLTMATQLMFGLVSALLTMLAELVFGEQGIIMIRGLLIGILDGVLGILFGIKVTVFASILELLFMVVAPFFAALASIATGTAAGTLFLSSVDFSFMMDIITGFIRALFLPVTLVAHALSFLIYIDEFYVILKPYWEIILQPIMYIIYAVRAVLCAINSLCCVPLVALPRCGLVKFVKCIPYCFMDDGCPLPGWGCF